MENPLLLQHTPYIPMGCILHPNRELHIAPLLPLLLLAIYFHHFYKNHITNGEINIGN